MNRRHGSTGLRLVVILVAASLFALLVLGVVRLAEDYPWSGLG